MAEAPRARNAGGYNSGTPGPDPEVTGWQEDLRETMEASDSLFSQYEKTLDIDFLHRAIALAETAITKTDPHHPNRAVVSVKLRKMQGTKFEHTQDREDLDMAWVWAMEGMDKTSRNTTNYATACGSILAVRRELESVYDQHRFPGGDSYRRYKRLGNLNDLNEAFIQVEKAIESYPPGNPARPNMLQNRVLLLLERFERLGDINDLELAASTNEETLRQCHIGDPEHTTALADSGSIFFGRFKRTGDDRCLQKAIGHAEEALAGTPQDHPDRASRLNNLGSSLSSRFKRIGDLGDLQKAIAHAEEALATASLDHPRRAAMHNNLGSWLSKRFKRIGELGDLQQAIEHAEEALTATPQDHPDRASRLHNLGSWLSLRFERTGDLGDLQKAIEHASEVLAGTPQDHPDRASRHNNLGSSLSSRFERIGNIGDLQQAIEHAEEALAATPHDHPDRAIRHNRLAVLLSARFDQIGDFGDLQTAVQHGEQALDATPHDHPDRAVFCTILGTFLESRFSRPHPENDSNRSLRLYIEGCDCRTSPPRVRVRAARKAASLLYSAEKFRESISILEDAVNLMPSLDLRFLNRDDQQHILSELSGLASTAASVALQAGREPYDSLKILELGRGIIMGFSIDSRSDVSDLKADHPLTFDRFHRLRGEIDKPTNIMNSASDGAPNEHQNRATSRRWEAVNEMEEILKYIRGLPGYDGFLLPPSQDALMKMATNGPIVVFNGTAYRSDAIIVTTSAITSLELPKLNYEETSRWMKQLASFGGGGLFKRNQENKQMKELLIWLWDAAVGPVFDHLECNGIVINEGAHDTNPQRVWWIGVGQLSMAPFHAAGDHTRGSTRNTLSRAISTYIPTIKALSYARQPQLQLLDECVASFSPERSKKAKILKRRNPRLLLVPMPKTPGAIDLPGVGKEIQHILDSADKNSIETKVVINPTPAEVLGKVQDHDIVHFACHGVSCINPSDSHLILFSQDGVDADKLLARDISNLVSQNAQIAYLSACSSAKNPSAKLADEVIHLASAFQLAGFSHTFANMWETDDNAASEVARDFYDLLFQNRGTGEDDHQRVSTAFYKAVKKVRDAKPGNPLLWAPFIHTGA